MEESTSQNTHTRARTRIYLVIGMGGMGFAGGSGVGRAGEDDEEGKQLLLQGNGRGAGQPPEDAFLLAYAVYFILGAGFLLPWNAFITAVDYFAYLYPGANVDRVFAVCYMLLGLLSLLLIVLHGAHRSSPRFRINLGLALYVLCLLVVPVMDLLYIRGRTGLYLGYYVTVAAVSVSGLGDALVQGGVIGSAGELPERYMQATCAGTAASGQRNVPLSFLFLLLFAKDLIFFYF